MSRWGISKVDGVVNPNTVLIRQHYRKLGLYYRKNHRKSDVYRGWTRDRYHRLCRMLNITKDELAALVCVPWRLMRQWLDANNIPPFVSLHFLIIEAAYVEATSGHRTEVMPLERLLSLRNTPPQPKGERKPPTKVAEISTGTPGEKPDS